LNALVDPLALSECRLTTVNVAARSLQVSGAGGIFLVAKRGCTGPEPFRLSDKRIAELAAWYAALEVTGQFHDLWGCGGDADCARFHDGNCGILRYGQSPNFLSGERIQCSVASLRGLVEEGGAYNA
jgi:hypothetical protein